MSNIRIAEIDTLQVRKMIASLRTIIIRYEIIKHSLFATPQDSTVHMQVLTEKLNPMFKQITEKLEQIDQYLLINSSGELTSARARSVTNQIVYNSTFKTASGLKHLGRKTYKQVSSFEERLIEACHVVGLSAQ